MYNDSLEDRLNSLNVDGENMDWFKSKGIEQNFERQYDQNMTTHCKKRPRLLITTFAFTTVDQEKMQVKWYQRGYAEFLP